MTIAGLARAGGVGVETVRYYQRRGLLRTPTRPGTQGHGGGVRRYGDADVQALRFIRSAQTAGFRLEEINALLELDARDDRDDRAHVRQLAVTRLHALDARIAELADARNALSRLVHACESQGPGRCPILMAFDSTGPDRKAALGKGTGQKRTTKGP